MSDQADGRPPTGREGSYDQGGGYAHLAGGRPRRAPSEDYYPEYDQRRSTGAQAGGYYPEDEREAGYGHYAHDGYPEDAGHADGTTYADDADSADHGGYVDEYGHWVYEDDVDAAGYGGAPGPGVRGHARRRAPRRRHPVRTVALALLALIVLLFVGLGLHFEGEINPGGHPGQAVSVTIPAGASSATIGSLLSKAGIIHGSSLFRYYVKLKGAGPLLPGTYQLATNEKYDQVISALSAGPPLVTERLVIPEGFTMAQIATRVAAMPKLNLSAAKFLAAASSGQVRSPYEPAGVNDLEGLIFPATYSFKQGMTETDVLQAMVDRFDQEATALNLSQGAATLGMTPYQVVTVASIVEREAKLTGDRPNVASAIYNRLKKGMSLGADSTLVYALRKADPSLAVASVNFNQPNPYNTRLNKGLPPTPIGNAGVPSLTAAISPASTTYLYFVETNPDGQLSFASTSSGFAHLQAQCRAANLC